MKPMNQRQDLLKGIVRPITAVRQLPLYRDDGHFRLVVNQLIDRERADSLSRDDLYLYIEYLFGVIADIYEPTLRPAVH